MTTPSDRIGLIVPDDDDAFSTEDLAANWEKVDAYAGHFVVASALPGDWGADQAGLQVWQIDTGLSWLWNGTTFERSAPKGWLGGDEKITDTNNNSDVMAILATAEVDVPRGGRRVEVTISWGETSASGGALRTVLAVFRDETEVRRWIIGTALGDGGSLTCYDQPGEGTFEYTFQFAVATAALPGTATIEAAATSPARIDVVEV
jgi:hypothetical protein